MFEIIENTIRNTIPPRNKFQYKDLISLNENENNIKLKNNVNVERYLLSLFEIDNIPTKKTRNKKQQNQEQEQNQLNQDQEQEQGKRTSFKQTIRNNVEKGEKRMKLLTTLVNVCWGLDEPSSVSILLDNNFEDHLERDSPIDYMILTLLDYLRHYNILNNQSAIPETQPILNENTIWNIPLTPEYQYPSSPTPENQHPFLSTPEYPSSTTHDSPTKSMEDIDFDFDNSSRMDMNFGNSDLPNHDNKINELEEVTQQLKSVVNKVEMNVDRFEEITNKLDAFESKLSNLKLDGDNNNNDEDDRMNQLDLKERVINSLKQSTQPKRAIDIGRELDSEKQKIQKILYDLKKSGKVNHNEDNTWSLVNNNQFEPSSPIPTQVQTQSNNLSDEILEYLRIHPSVTALDITREFNSEKKKIQKILYDLESSREVEKSEDTPPKWKIKSKRPRSDC